MSIEIPKRFLYVSNNENKQHYEIRQLKKEGEEKVNVNFIKPLILNNGFYYY